MYAIPFCVGKLSCHKTSASQPLFLLSTILEPPCLKTPVVDKAILPQADLATLPSSSIAFPRLCLQEDLLLLEAVLALNSKVHCSTIHLGSVFLLLPPESSPQEHRSSPHRLLHPSGTSQCLDTVPSHTFSSVLLLFGAGCDITALSGGGGGGGGGVFFKALSHGSS